MQSKSPRIEIRPRDIRWGQGARYFSVENLGGAYDFMVSLDRCKPVWISTGERQRLKAFEWHRLEKFLAYAKAQGLEVVQP